MTPLPTALRNQLSKVIAEARRVAEAGARQALESLAVGRHAYFGAMSVEDRALRNRLRAHGRQLGDQRDRTRGTQSIERLVHEVAYEHWHRMLFARFLAENGLLIEPNSGVAITMEECEELARETGEDPRAMAASFAQRALPQIFRSEDPVLEVTLAPEARQALDRLLESLPSEVFTAIDSLGWTYQFWQSEKKGEVNKSGVKIGADELPAVTQLFTEHYMVLFLYHNTIGAWHAAKILVDNPELAKTAASEKELRRAVRLTAAGGYDFEYLRFVRTQEEGNEDDQPTGPWRPAAGSFDGWPSAAKELKVLDPCCGSGHFLVEGLELLVRLRMQEETLPLEEAIAGVISENLHGLEIDLRCTQIAAFNLAFAAWKRVGRPMELPPLNIACSGLTIGSTKKEWIALAGDDVRLRAGMEWLYDLFEKAPELGSLIDPKELEGDLLTVDFAELDILLKQIAARERYDLEDIERTVAAGGMARAAELLSDGYSLVITNFPFLGFKRQSETLRRFCKEEYEMSQSGLATTFVERSSKMLRARGVVASVVNQTWLFQPTSKELRAKLLEEQTWCFVARLGQRAFEMISGDVVSAALFMYRQGCPIQEASFAYMDVQSARSATAKSSQLRSEQPAVLLQSHVRRNPGAEVTDLSLSQHELLSDIAVSASGLKTGDRERFNHCMWEQQLPDSAWDYYQSSSKSRDPYSGRTEAILWEQGQGRLAALADSVRHLNHVAQNWQRGQDVWGRRGVAVSAVGSIRVQIYQGARFDSGVTVIAPNSDSCLPAVWTYCASEDFETALRRIDSKVSITTSTVVKVPFDLRTWQKIAEQEFPAGLPEPYSEDPTQWLFHGYPARTESGTTLQVAVARLLGYRWPPELDSELHLEKAARRWVERCTELGNLSDEDGVVCLSATRGERSAADRLRELLGATFGPDWSASKERDLLSEASKATRPAETLELWLRDRFFEEHCKLFHHRPFIWHIWDGNKDGFSALVNCHKLCGRNGEGRRTLKTLTYSYLGDWIDRQTMEQRAGKEGADARLAAAQDLQAQLEKILAGEPPCDVFVRWKPLHEQTIGWDPDVNDGVRLNIRPFMKAELRTGGKKGAGVLRWKPNIKWNKDRGKEPQGLRPKETFPWFWSCPGDGTAEERTDFAGGDDFDGNRWNNLHHTSEAKRAARAKAEEAAQ